MLLQPSEARDQPRTLAQKRGTALSHTGPKAHNTGKGPRSPHLLPGGTVRPQAGRAGHSARGPLFPFVNWWPWTRPQEFFLV